MEKLTDYGPLGIMLLVALGAIAYLFKENKTLEKEKFELVKEVNTQVTLTLDSVDNTMKALIIAIGSKEDRHEKSIETHSSPSN